LLERWSGSYVLTIAAYNAGSGNVAAWVDTYGDPRNPGMDVIDWIELIPFGETRNYVQRVLENIQVYRDRLTGGAQPLEIVTDLTRSYAPAYVPLPAPAPRG
jgi:soluble lytic murein transglycosylase